jgi:16S rRNA pseudouridine516 synthase
MGNRKDTLEGILHGQGFGSRRECRGLIRAGQVELAAGDDWRRAEDPEAEIDPAGLRFKVRGEAFPYRQALHVAFHKPADTECSRSPGQYRSVFSFFPEAFLRRGLQAVGRLDADTTGLLILTDSGDLNHFLTSPKRHVPKTYRVETRHTISAEQAAKLAAGVLLRDEDAPTLPAIVELLNGNTCLLTISEGKYHQVKRMLAAVGNRVEKIHRVSIGALKLDPELAEGTWRYLEAEDLQQLGYDPVSPR